MSRAPRPGSLDPAAAAHPRRSLAVPAGFLFLVSGAAGLVYEVAWSRMLARVLGGSWPAVVAVVAAFLGGLALGAALGGRLAPRLPRPLRTYAILEAGIGLYCAAFPLVLAGLDPAFGWCYRHLAGNPAAHAAARFLIAAVALLPPTVAMGATLPVLVSALVGDGDATVLGGTGLLYGLNTVGAAGGAAAAGFLLLPGLGFRGTLLAGVAANLAVAAVALLLDRGRSAAQAPGAPAAAFPPPPPPAEPLRPALRGALLLLAFGSGVASMLYQLGWTRTLVLSFGSSVHAFTLIVATFILGLGLGGLLAPLLRREGTRLLPALVLLEAAVGLGGWASVLQGAALPCAVADFTASGPASYGALLRWEALRALSLALLPTLAMGAAFPVLVSVLAREGSGASRAVGRVYAWNTLGVIAGSLGGGLLLLPVLGTRGMLLAATVGNLLLAAAVAAAAFPPRRGLPAAGGLAAAAVLAAAAAPGWPAAALHSGPYLYGRVYAEVAAAERMSTARAVRDRHWDMPFAEEGRGASVAVFRDPDGGLFLRINGKTDASSGGDMDTQHLLAHLPMLAHPAPDRVLVVGLASGVSVAAAASHGPRVLDVAEISPEVARAERLFRPFNGDVLSRPGVRVLLEDGRTHLEHSGETYDVVVSEPTNPWIAGVSDLFTVEYFRACRERLAPGGFLCVWLQAYGLTVEDFRLVVRTVRSVFPGATVWESAPWEDYLVIAPRDDGADVAAAVAGRAWPAGDAAGSLERTGIRTREDALALLFLGRGPAAAFAEGGAARDLHTDDRLQLEFRAPRSVFGAGVEGLPTVRGLESLRDPGPVESLPGVDAARLRAVRGARSEALAGLAASRDEDPAADGPLLPLLLRDPARREALLPRLPRSLRVPLEARFAASGDAPPAVSEDEADWLLGAHAIGRLEAARAAGAAELWAADALASALARRGERNLSDGSLDEAEADFRRVRELQPRNALVPWFLSQAAFRRADGRSRPALEEALRLAEEAVALGPRCEYALVQRGSVLHALGRTEEAVRALGEALEIRPDSVRAAASLAWIRRAQGRRDDARALVEEGLRLEPANPGLLLLRRQMRDEE